MTAGFDTDDYDEVDSGEGFDEERKMKCWLKALIITCSVIFGLAFLAFLAVFVVFPIVFMESLTVERYFMFFNLDNPKNPDFRHPDKYGIKGVNNFYITTKDSEGGGLVSIGAWQIVPATKINTSETNVEQLLRDEKDFPILLYFHGVACNRILPIVGYNLLRQHFHVFAIDYRGYGDSSDVALTESGIIHDNVQVYEWIKQRTNQPIYMWGHSLGAALSIHTVKALNERNIRPTGLVVESAFSTMREEVMNNALGKIFIWLAYFNSTVLDPLDEHGFHFRSTTNIAGVTVPTMHMHAEDDNVIPFRLGTKLMNEARKRDGLQNYTLWHSFSKDLGYSHNNIIKDPRIPEYINEFKALCQAKIQADSRKAKGIRK